MPKHQVSANVDRSIKPYDVPEEAAVCAAICAVLHDRSGVDRRPVQWRGGMEAEPAAASRSTIPDDRAPVSLWRAVLASFLEGFGAYGLALHPVADMPSDRAIARQSAQNHLELARPFRIASPGQRPASHRGALASIARAIETFRDHWRRERDIRRAVAALALLDERTLRDMGIQNRDEIERVVRFCHDC